MSSVWGKPFMPTHKDLSDMLPWEAPPEPICGGLEDPYEDHQVFLLDAFYYFLSHYKCTLYCDIRERKLLPAVVRPNHNKVLYYLYLNNKPVARHHILTRCVVIFCRGLNPSIYYLWEDELLVRNYDKVEVCGNDVYFVRQHDDVANVELLL